MDIPVVMEYFDAIARGDLVGLEDLVTRDGKIARAEMLA